MKKLEVLKNALCEKGYFVYFNSEEEGLFVSAKTGRLREGTNELSSKYVASIFFEEGKFKISQVRVPYFKTWEVDTMNDVLEYLLTHRPNIPVGEENTWT